MMILGLRAMFLTTTLTSLKTLVTVMASRVILCWFRRFLVRNIFGSDFSRYKSFLELIFLRYGRFLGAIFLGTKDFWNQSPLGMEDFREQFLLVQKIFGSDLSLVRKIRVSEYSLAKEFQECQTFDRQPRGPGHHGVWVSQARHSRCVPADLQPEQVAEH